METKKTDHEPISLKDKGIFYLNSDINEASSKEVVTWILEANIQKKKLDKLTLIITSYGGYIVSGFAIIDAMRGSSIPVHTIGLGVISSCGLLIFMAGKKNHRVLTPNTAILSHQWAGGNYGKEHELLAGVRANELVTQKVMAHYKKCTGLSDKIIRAKLLPPSDLWMSANEGLEYNLWDEIKDMK